MTRTPLTPASTEHAGPAPLRPRQIGALRVPSPDALPERTILRRDTVFRRSLAIADLAAAALAVFLGVVVIGDDRVTPALLLGIPAVVAVAKLVGLYDRDRDVLRKDTLVEAPTLFQVAMLYTLAMTVGADLFFEGRLGPQQVAGLWILLFASMLLLRALTRRVVTRSTAAERCLVVGDRASEARLRQKLASSRSVNATVVGRVALDTDEREEDRSDVLGSFEQLERVVREHAVQRVILAPSRESTDVLDATRFIKSLGVKVSLLPRLFEVVGSSVRFDDVDGLMLLGVPAYGLTKSSRAVKRGFDLVGAGAGLLVLAPLFLAIAVAIKLDSPGPVLFRQRRIGLKGRRFELLKFRSMVADAASRKPGLVELNEAGPGLFKIANDPRITRVGAMLRRFSLDELPQLLNVLAGDMSLVGPRPLVPEDDGHVEGWDRHRLVVPPGVTGAWQVLGSSRVPMHEMVKLDYLYAANWSLWSDMKILLRTIAHVSGRRGI